MFLQCQSGEVSQNQWFYISGHWNRWAIIGVIAKRVRAIDGQLSSDDSTAKYRCIIRHKVLTQTSVRKVFVLQHRSGTLLNNHLVYSTCLAWYPTMCFQERSGKLLQTNLCYSVPVREYVNKTICFCGSGHRHRKQTIDSTVDWVWGTAGPPSGPRIRGMHVK